MGLGWQVDSYCTSCGFDILSADDDDLESLIVSMEAKVEYLYTEHIKQGKCGNDF